MSVAVIATSTAQKKAARTAFPESPKAKKHAATSAAVASSTAGYSQLIRTPQERQRPCSTK
jgi:hypothetical protein